MGVLLMFTSFLFNDWERRTKTTMFFEENFKKKEKEKKKKEEISDMVSGWNQSNKGDELFSMCITRWETEWTGKKMK
jgi:hypothetical protein